MSGGSGAPGDSQRARLPLPWFCSEGGSNFLGESGGVTNLLSIISPSTPQGGESCLRETEISFTPSGSLGERGGRETGSVTAHLCLSRGSSAEMFPVPLGSSPWCGPQAGQQGAAGLRLVFQLPCLGAGLAVEEIRPQQMLLHARCVPCSSENIPGPQGPKIADCDYLKPVTISHHLTSSGGVGVGVQVLEAKGAGNACACLWALSSMVGGLLLQQPGLSCA